MYLPAHFNEGERAVQLELMRQYPLATVIISGANGLSVNHLPLLVSVDGDTVILRGHVARANPLWRQCDAETSAVAVFHGPQAYVTPAFYPAKQVHGRVVPTWNYAVVHAHGSLRAIDDPQWVAGLVADLTATHEATRAAPWQVSDAPAAFIAGQLQAIVGVELVVARIEAKFKLSQNRDAGDRAGVTSGLSASQDGAAVAALMRAREP